MLNYVRIELVFPAPAGINRIRSIAARVAVSVPRASGDKPGIMSSKDWLITCSPRQRG
ncbi:hypothetical protein IHF30_002326 [Salmonella enterica]|nr:hypothetical protein [Salmonella enterica]